MNNSLCLIMDNIITITKCLYKYYDANNGVYRCINIAYMTYQKLEHCRTYNDDTILIISKYIFKGVRIDKPADLKLRNYQTQCCQIM